MTFLKKVVRQILMLFYSVYLRYRFKIRLSYKSIINSKTKLGEGCVLHSGVFVPNSQIGKGTYIGPQSHLQYAAIGSFCSIARGVQILSSTHPVKKFVSIHPAFYSISNQTALSYTDKQLFNERVFLNDQVSVSIGSDVWIGTNVLILGGIKIGHGAIIAAGSVVTKDVDDFEIVGGVPARNIKFRFNEYERSILLKIKWWEKDETWLKKNSHLFSDVSEFIKKFER